MASLALTAVEERFANNFVASRSLARAYKETYPDQTGHWTASRLHREGRRLFERYHVRQRIQELTDAGSTGLVTVARLTEIFMSIYEADPNELSSVRVGACRYCNGQDHRYHWREHEYLEALTNAEFSKAPRIPDVGGGLDYDHTAAPHPECPKCGGEGVTRTVFHDTENLSPGARYLYGGVKQTKDGMQLIVADRMKALELVGRVIGAFNDKLDLKANVRSISAATVAMTSDPAAAAKAYMEMVNGIKAD